jgi:hypothetical protein
MFQVMTGESWFSVVSRSSEDQLPYFSFLFFSSYFVFASFILKNVLTGIILDAMSSSHADEEEEDEEAMNIKDKISKVQNSFANLGQRLQRIKLALGEGNVEVKKEERVFQSDAQLNDDDVNQQLIVGSNSTDGNQNLLSPRSEFKNVEEVENSPLISRDQDQNDLLE